MRAGDPRFFPQGGPRTLAAIAAAAGGTLAPGADPDHTLLGVAPLQTAGPEEASFLDNRRYRDALAATRAGAVLLRPDLAAEVPEGTAAITLADPYAGWARVAALFHPAPPPVPGIHPSAVVDPSARVDPSAEIGPLVVIGAGAEIGPGTIIGPGTTIGPGSVIGPDCRIGAQVSISHALIGARVGILPGTRIGQEGFGFAPTRQGFLPVPQLGRVVIGDDVDIGANCTIDRGSLRDTVIGAGSRLDNLVQVAHNVEIGRACVLVAQVGISGSTVLEDQVMVGGQAGMTGHLRIGRGAQIGAQAGVMADVPAGARMLGSPAQPAAAELRQVAMLHRMTARGRRGGDA